MYIVRPPVCQQVLNKNPKISSVPVNSIRVQIHAIRQIKIDTEAPADVRKDIGRGLRFRSLPQMPCGRGGYQQMDVYSEYGGRGSPVMVRK